MIDLNHPDLRTRDILRLVSLKQNSLVWDRGQNPESEWEYASLESEAHRLRLFAWLHSKGVEDQLAFIKFGEAKAPVGNMKWGDILQRPEDFFGSKIFQSVATDFSWQLEYHPVRIARFGRWLVGS